MFRFDHTGTRPLLSMVADDAGKLHVLWHTDSSTTGSPVIGGDRFATPALSGSDVIVPTLTGIAVVVAPTQWHDTL